MDNICRIMLDIETTGKTPGCNILSIGATTFFCPQRILFYSGIHWDNLNPDFCNETDTMEWWRAQKQGVAAVAFGGKNTYLKALQDFTEFIHRSQRDYGKLHIYANGAAFDFPILEYAYKAVGLNIPWNYFERQCYSTLKAHFPRVPKPKLEGSKHNALYDAINQANHCEAILRFIS